MKNLTDWARITHAAIDARNDLARLLPDLEAAIKTMPTDLLIRVRDVAARHSNALRSAVKFPSGPSGGRRRSSGI